MKEDTNSRNCQDSPKQNHGGGEDSLTPAIKVKNKLSSPNLYTSKIVIQINHQTLKQIDLARRIMRVTRSKYLEMAAINLFKEVENHGMFIQQAKYLGIDLEKQHTNKET